MSRTHAPLFPVPTSSFLSFSATFPTSTAPWWKARKRLTVKICRWVSLYPFHHRINAHQCPDSSQVRDPEYRWIRYLIFTSSTLGESPPPPGACFGREDLIEKVVNFAEHLTPIALIGAGGIGKTSIALTVLQHDHIKKRFGSNRRFIRCDQFPASQTHFLSRLSEVIGAGVENPEDLTPLRPFLSSREMILVLDNVESLLDPHEAGAREIYTTVEELSRFDTMCLIVTSRISTVPRLCKRPIIPTLSVESACDIFYGIYDNGGRSDIIDNLLRRLDFHALSITLLATTASHNMWDYDRLAEEWDARRTQVLQTDYNESLAATIDLSLASPTFRELGPDARNLLGVVAFFPQGINENLDWSYPTIPNRKNTFDKFCALSLTYRSNGFVAMLAPLRDHLSPKDPISSPLLQTIKECYFTRLSVPADPGEPGFEEAQWIISEDANVEHLLDVFTIVDANSVGVWDACSQFMRHLYWHKPRLIVLGQKIEGLRDDHPPKAQCLVRLALLFQKVGNNVEHKRLLVHSLRLRREEGNDIQVAETLWALSSANRSLGLCKEGIQQTEEALEIHERLNNRLGQARALRRRARLLHADKQLDAAEDSAFRAMNLLLDTGEEYEACHCHRLLGNIYHSKGEMGRALKYLETALEIASPFNWHGQLFWNHHSLAEFFLAENRFDDTHTHIEHTKLHAINNTYRLARTMLLRAQFWYKQDRFDEAMSEAMCATDTFKKFGNVKQLGICRNLLQQIEARTKKLDTSGESDFNGESLEVVPLPTAVDFQFTVQ